MVELLVSMGIFTFLASLGLFVSMDFYHGYAFRSQASVFISAIQRARSRSMDNINAAPHGLHLTTTGYTLFQGPSYAGRNTDYDEDFVWEGGVTATGPDDIIFTQLTGGSNTDDAVILTDDVRTATISLNYEGRISW